MKTIHLHIFITLETLDLSRHFWKACYKKISYFKKGLTDFSTILCLKDLYMPIPKSCLKITMWALLILNCFTKTNRTYQLLIKNRKVQCKELFTELICSNSIFELKTEYLFEHLKCFACCVGALYSEFKSSNPIFDRIMFERYPIFELKSN